MIKDFLKAASKNDVKELERILSLNQGNENFINSANTSGSTALHKAAEKGRYEAAEFLIENGATSKKSRTALQVACQHGHTKVAELLIKNNADINIQGNALYSGMSPLQEACRNGRYDTAKMLIKHGVKIDQQHEVLGNALMLTGHSRHSNIAELLLASGANVDIRDISGDTAFHHACSFGDIRTIKAHLNNDINIDIRGAGGKTPLMEVVSQYGNIKDTGGIEAIDLLLNKNANINAQDNYGNTTLMHLCSSDRQSEYPKIQLEIALHLIEKGADFSLQNKNGETAKDVATEHKLVSITALLEELELQAYLDSLQVPEEIETAPSGSTSTAPLPVQPVKRTQSQAEIENAALAASIENDDQEADKTELDKNFDRTEAKVRKQVAAAEQDYDRAMGL